MPVRIFCLALFYAASVGCNKPTQTSFADSGIERQDIPTEDGVFAKGQRDRTVVLLTEAAVTKLRGVLQTDASKFVRVSVKNEGPTGFMHDLQLVDALEEGDIVDNSQGIKLVVDARSAIYLEGATIDWIVQPDGTAGFKFDNPNAVEEE